METKINIAAILKDKPQGIKLYNWLYNTNVELDTISTTDEETVIWCTKKKDINTTTHFSFSKLGTMRGCLDGLQILLPSKEMRDWRKFSWKKGDVLVHKDGDVYIIFERFVDDTYCSFVGKYYLWKENNNTEQFYENERLLTSDFQKAGKDAAQTYFNTIEKKLGGKLNLETLEIEKQLEFKNGDVLFVKCDRQDFIEIFNYSKKNGDLYDHASLDIATQNLDISGKYRICKDEIVEIRIATEEEKQQLFSALAKEGKAWDSEKKKVVGLKPKWTPKPFDRVITRNTADDVWTANIFSHMDSHGEYVTIACVGGYTHCLPYNEETAKLIGTTKDVEG